MATKKGNGHDPATTAIVEALGRIEKQAEATNKRLDGMAEDLAAVRADVSSLKNEVSSLRAEMRVDVAELALRILKLEAAVFPPPRAPTRAEPKRRAG